MIVTTLSLASALSLAAAGSSGPTPASCGPKDPLQVVPNGAEVLGQLDARRLTASTVYQLNRTELDKALQAEPQLAAFASCKVKPEQFSSVTFGSQGSDRVVVMARGTGLGNPDTLECIANKLEGKTGAWNRKKDGCLTVMDRGGDWTVYLVDDQTAVLTTSAWQDPVLARLKGSGTTAITGSMAGLVSRVDRSRPLWFAGKLGASARASLTGTSAEQLESVGAAVGFARGLDLAVVLRMTGPEGARALQSEIGTALPMLESLASSINIPLNVIKRLSVKAKGASVKISASATPAELKQIRSALEQAAAP
jgi:hypothetical protein